MTDKPLNCVGSDKAQHDFKTHPALGLEEVMTKDKQTMPTSPTEILITGKGFHGFWETPDKALHSGTKPKYIRLENNPDYIITKKADVGDGELLPCPISSKKAYLIKEGYNYRGKDLFHVICHKSGIRTKKYISPNDAIKAWNTRPTPKPDGDALEALDELEIDMKSSARNDYPSANEYPSQMLKLNNEIDWIEEKIKTIRQALQAQAERED